MQNKAFKYDRCDENESIITAIFFRYSGGIDFHVERDDQYIYVNLSGREDLVIEAIKDLMVNICYTIDF